MKFKSALNEKRPRKVFDMNKTLAALALAMIGCTNNASADLLMAIGKPYEIGRVIIQGEQLTPLTREDIKAHPEFTDIQSPTSDALLTKNYTELFSCTSSGVLTCTFLFRNNEGGLVNVVVTVDEDPAGPTRIESIKPNGYTITPWRQIAPTLMILQERVALSNKSALPAGLAPPSKFSKLEECNNICISKTLSFLSQNNILTEASQYTDAVSGMSVPDFRHMDVATLNKTLPNYMLQPVVTTSPNDAIYKSNLAFALNKITNAVQSCTFIASKTQCDLLFKDMNGYLFRITGAGYDLGSFTINNVAIVNGLPEYASLSSKELVYQMSTKTRNDLYRNNKAGFRAYMFKQFKESKNQIELYAAVIDSNSLQGGFCDQYVAEIYNYAQSGQSDSIKELMMDKFLDALYKAGCTTQQ